MVSGPEIRKARTKKRRERRGRAAESGAVLLAIALAFIAKSRFVFSLAMAAMTCLAIYGLFQFDWIREASTRFVQAVRAVLGIVLICGGIALYGVLGWPPVHRHTLGDKERRIFEQALPAKDGSQVAIQLQCPQNDEKDCAYAAQFESLFGEAGWNISPGVERVSVGRPAQGVALIRHGTNDSPRPKWNEGGWVKETQAGYDVYRAFSNVGIEMSGQSMFATPENEIDIYFGPERDDESDPTFLTQQEVTTKYYLDHPNHTKPAAK